MTRPAEPHGDQLVLGPRHGAEDGAGQRALEAYLELDGRAPEPPRKRFIDYPRAGRRGFTRWIPSWRLVTSLILLGVASVTGLVLFLYTTTELPSSQNPDAEFNATIVYDGTGQELGRFAAQNRVFVPLKDIPLTMQRAVLSAEDRTFYSNTGVSFTGVARAALNNLRGGATQGGSTITQQYVKNAYSSVTDRSYSRKLNEFFVSLKVAREKSKDDILEGYLNIIYFGRGCYGIEAAAHCYFDKPVGKLTLSEQAYLAGIINGPELYDSGTTAAKTAARARWNYVLDGMVTQGWVSKNTRNHVGAEPPTPIPRQDSTTGNSLGSQQRYAMAMVKAEAAQLGISESDLLRKGFKIYTTFRPGLVNKASRAIGEVLGPRNKWPAGTEAALVTVDVKTGAVVSIYGGDGKRAQNAVTQDQVQAGSTFKPFGLIAGLEGKRDPGDCKTAPPPDDQSVSLRTEFDGRSPQTFKGGYKVSNFEPGNPGMIDLVKATAESVNTVFVGLNEKVGAQHTMDVAVCAGYPRNTPDLLATPSNVLGTSSPHPIDVARSFATLAAQGVRHDTFVITKILQPVNGRDIPITQHDPATSQHTVFNSGVVADATYAMQAVVKEGTASYVRRLDRPVAGKTGTTTDNKSAWFAGFTPQYATVVALYRLSDAGGQEKLQPWKCGCKEVTGGTLPAKVWTEYMQKALEGVPVEEFPEPTYGGGQQDQPTEQPTTEDPAPTTTEPQQQPQPSQPQQQPQPTQPDRTWDPRPTSPPEPTPSDGGQPQPQPSDGGQPTDGQQPGPPPGVNPSPDQ